MIPPLFLWFLHRYDVTTFARVVSKMNVNERWVHSATTWWCGELLLLPASSPSTVVFAMCSGTVFRLRHRRLKWSNSQPSSLRLFGCVSWSIILWSHLHLCTVMHRTGLTFIWLFICESFFFFKYSKLLARLLNMHWRVEGQGHLVFGPLKSLGRPWCNPYNK